VEQRDSDGLTCTRCGAVTTSAGALRAHLRAHRDVDCLSRYCMYSHSNHELVRAHNAQHEQWVRNRKGSAPFKCDCCDAVFASCTQQLYHFRKAHRLDRLNCAFCYFHPRSADELLEHGDEHVLHGDNKCVHCGCTGQSAIQVERHERRHTDGVPMECPYCEFKSVCVADLAAHQRLHMGGALLDNKTHVCRTPGCSRMFLKAAELRRHELTHSTESPWRCGVCGFRCSRKDNLTAHLRRHSQEEIAAASAAGDVVPSAVAAL
jgi:KRAB domain-containing zinc finger protein